MQGGSYRWRLLGILWLVQIVVFAFPTYASSVINPYMATALHLNRQSLSVPYSVYLLMVGLPAPLVALILTRFGAKKIQLAGCFLIMAGALGMALFVHDVVQATIAFGVVVGAGVAAAAQVPPQVTVVQWFAKDRALGLSILNSANGIGGIIAAQAVSHAIIAYKGDWRAGWWVIAGLALAAGVVAALFVREHTPEAADPAAPSEAGPARRQAFVTRETWTVREAVGTLPFWLIQIAFTVGSVGFAVVIVHGVVHLKDLGYSASAAAWVISLLTASLLLGKVLVAVFGDRFDPRYVWSAVLLAMVAGVLAAINPHDNWQLWVFAVGVGTGMGGGLVAMMTVIGNYYGAKAFGALVGITLAINTIASAVVPVLAGRLFDETKSYALVFYSIGACCALGAMLTLLMRKPERGSPEASSMTPELADKAA